jgi:hypothetical protein
MTKAIAVAALILLATAGCGSADDVTLDDLREVEAQRDVASQRAAELEELLAAAEAETDTAREMLDQRAVRPAPEKAPETTGDAGAGDQLRKTFLTDAVLDCAQVVAHSPDYEPRLESAAELWNHCLGEMNELIAGVNEREIAGRLACSTSGPDTFDLVNVWIADAFRLQALSVAKGDPIDTQAAVTTVQLYCEIAFGDV